MKRRAAPGVFAGLCLFLTVSAAFAAPVAQQPAPRLTKPMQRCAALEAQAAGLYKIHADVP